jgi:hypothetical protein
LTEHLSEIGLEVDVLTGTFRHDTGPLDRRG